MFKTEQSPLCLQDQQPITANTLWLKLINPNPAEISDFAEKYDIPREFIEAVLDPHAIARIQQQQNTTLILSHLPLEHLGETHSAFSTQAFGLIIGPQYVLMVCANEHIIFDRMLQHHLTEQNQYPLSYFIFRLLELVADQFIYATKVVNQRVVEVEEELKKSIKNKQIFTLLKHSKSLNRFTNALKGNSKVLTALHTQPRFASSEAADYLLLNVMVETEQANAMAEIHNINLCNLMDAYSAAIENNLSLLVQYLSIYVIVGAIPLGIASLFGMNTPLPMQENPYALVYLALISVVITTLMIFYFKKRQII